MGGCDGHNGYFGFIVAVDLGDGLYFCLILVGPDDRLIVVLDVLDDEFSLTGVDDGGIIDDGTEGQGTMTANHLDGVKDLYVLHEGIHTHFLYILYYVYRINMEHYIHPNTN